MDSKILYVFLSDVTIAIRVKELNQLERNKLRHYYAMSRQDEPNPLLWLATQAGKSGDLAYKHPNNDLPGLYPNILTPFLVNNPDMVALSPNLTCILLLK